ncbi:MAG: DUF1569 domain-containing protein [Phycisphaerales bacterium]|nr:DUF1569 domain-containing protein [Planctomycetota bacterium]MCH8508501.1 DUF1569 domain-containing protein [Phycisphaerales bacterium]
MAKRRDWSPAGFRSLDELGAELDAMEDEERAGVLRATGQWSPGQILDHCATLMRCSFDGFGGVRMPRLMRAAGPLMRPLVGKVQLRPGVRLPRGARGLLPREGVSFAEGLAAMRSQLARLEAGERMEADSPLLGRMSHERWVVLHLDHCRMHMGFLRREPAPPGDGRNG